MYSIGESWKVGTDQRLNWDEVFIVYVCRIVIAAGDFNCSKEAIDSAKILDDPVILILAIFENLYHSFSSSFSLLFKGSIKKQPL